MAFPVDILATVDPESLEQSAKDYMSKLLNRNSEMHEYLNMPESKKIEIGLCNVGFVPLYGLNIKQKVLALFSPEEPLKAVGLYLLNRWWSAEDILKTADSSRAGLIQVETPGERVVLYVLNRIIYRTKEMARDDVPFLCHAEDETAKILWKNGEAVGFYSVKPEGKLCSSFLTHCYQLPIMDTIFIRKYHRGNGHGLQMLEDFVKSFKTDCMGLKYPLSPAMYKVCKKYLSLYPEDTELLWEIKGVGSPFQRTQIARKLHAMDLNGNPQVVTKLNFDTGGSDLPMEAGVKQEWETMEYTEVVEEVVQIKTTKEVRDRPVTTDCSKCFMLKIAASAGTKDTTEEILRVEDIEPDVQSAEGDPVHMDSTLSSNSKELELKDTVETMTHDVTPMSEITHLHCEEQKKMNPKPTHQSEMEKEKVVEITPVVAIRSLKGNEDAQIMKPFDVTIVPVDLQPLELQQVEIKMSSETEAVKEKSVEVTEMKDDLNKELPLDGRQPFEEVLESKIDHTDLEESTNEDGVEDKAGMVKVSVVENIVDETKEAEVVKKEAGALEVSLVEKEQSEQMKEKDMAERESDVVQECLCEKEQETKDPEDVNAAEVEVEGKVYEPSGPEHSEEQEEDPASERVPAEIVQSTEEATSALKLQRVAAVLVDVDKIPTTHTEGSEDTKGTLQPESPDHRENTEKDQEVEMTASENVTDEVMDKIENASSKETEEMMETEERVITLDLEKVSELTTAENKMEEFQEERALKETKSNQDTAGEEIKHKDIIESIEDHERVKSDDQMKLPEADKSNTVTPFQRSRRLKHQAAGRELAKSALRSSTKTDKATSKPQTVKQQGKTKQAIDDSEVQEMEEVVESHAGTAVEKKIEPVLNESALSDIYEERNVSAEPLFGKKTDYQTLMDVENKTEDENSQDENKAGTKLRKEDEEKLTAEELGETAKDDEKLAVDGHNAEDLRALEIVVEGESPEISAAEPVEEQEEEPALESMPIEDDVAEETTSTLKLQNVAIVLLDFNKASSKHESDDNKMDTGTSQPQEGVVQEITDHRNEGEEGVNQRECEVEPSEKEHDVEMTENEHEETAEVRDERMEIEENIMSKVEDKSPKSTFTEEKKIDEAQEEEFGRQTNTNQDLSCEEPKIQGIELSEDDEGLKSGDQIELSEDKVSKTSFVTPLRCSRRLKHQAPESELTKRVLRSASKAAISTSKTKAVEQQVETNQSVDGPEIEQTKDVLELHTETAVEEKIEPDIITTEMDHVKAVEGITPGPPAAEPVEEQEPASETGPAEDDDAEKVTSGLKLQKVAAVLVDFDKVSTTHSEAGKDDWGTSRPQEEVDLELHKQESTDTKYQAEQTEKDLVEEMTENENKSSAEETDENVKTERLVLNDEDKVAESVVTDEEIMEEVQRETDTAQEIQTEEPKSLHILESSEDEDEGSDLLNLDEEEDEVSMVTPLRCSRRLKDQGAESELTKRVLRRLARLTNQTTLQQRHKQRIKAMILEEPEQLDESKNDEMNTRLGPEVALGVHMESETVHVFDESGPVNKISAVQSTCKEGSNLEKDEMEDDHRNEGEENISSEDIPEQNKMAPEDVIHGEAEQICTSGEKSAVEMEHSHLMKEVQDKVQEEGAAEMAPGEDGENIMETTSALTLQEASVVLVDVKKVHPNLTEEENLERGSVSLTEGDPADLNTAAKDTVEEDGNIVMSNLDDETTETSKLEDEKYSDEFRVDEESKPEQFTLHDPHLTQDSVLKECSETNTPVQDNMGLHNTEVVRDISVEQEEELALVEEWENVVESTAMLKLHKAAVVLVDFQIQTSGNETVGNETIQSQDVTSLTEPNEEIASVEMKVMDPVTEKKEEAVEVGTDNTLITNDEQDRDILAEEAVKDDVKQVEDINLKEKCTSAELDTNKTSSQDEDFSVYPSRDLGPRTLPLKTTPKRKSRHLQDVYKETKVNENTGEESSDEETETVFIRHLRRRTITVTPRKRSKHLTVTRVAEPELEAHETKVCQEMVAVQNTEEGRTAVEERQESKCNSEEVPSVSELVRKDQRQAKTIPGNDAGKVEEVTDGEKDMGEEATDGEIQVEGDLPDEHQEKDKHDMLNQEQVRSANSEQESDQQEETFEEDLNRRVEEKRLEEETDSTMNISIIEGVLDQSEESEGVERRDLRKQTISAKAASARKSKRLCKHDQGENDGHIDVLVNTEDSASLELTVMEMADVKSPAENETTDQGKAKDLEDTNTIGGETLLSEVLNVSEDDTNTKLSAHEEEKADENREEQSVTEEKMECENSAGQSHKVADTPEEPRQSEESAEGMTEASVTVDENLTLKLDEELNSNDAEGNRVVEKTKASMQESEKEITDAEQESGVMTACISKGWKSATPERRSAQRGRRLLQNSPSEMGEEVKEVVGEEEKKPQHKKRKAVAERTPRRSKRLARAEIV